MRLCSQRASSGWTPTGSIHDALTIPSIEQISSNAGGAQSACWPHWFLTILEVMQRHPCRITAISDGMQGIKAHLLVCIRGETAAELQQLPAALIACPGSCHQCLKVTMSRMAFVSAQTQEDLETWKLAQHSESPGCGPEGHIYTQIPCIYIPLSGFADSLQCNAMQCSLQVTFYFFFYICWSVASRVSEVSWLVGVMT